MKKIITILIIIICTSFSASALNYLLCLNGQAYYIVTNSQNVITGWTTAGYCAGGDWIIQVMVTSSGNGNQKGATLATQLNQYLDLDGPYDDSELPSEIIGEEEPPYTIAEIMDWLGIHSMGTIALIDPDLLDDEPLAWLTTHARLEQQIVSKNDDNSLPDFNLYPNPAKDKILIQWVSLFSSNFSFELEIINNIGQTLRREIIFIKEENLKTERSINISGLPKGIYFLRLKNNNQQINKYFVKN